MYKKKKSGRSRKAPYVPITKEHVKHWSWCMKNGIGMCVTPDWTNIEMWKVEVIINGKVSVDPKYYKGEEAMTKMFDYYKYYYNKNNENG
tara:strand:- start:108 stop:377 length:270 start_codon:yes stop_codon:yes gene_type:complete